MLTSTLVFDPAFLKAIGDHKLRTLLVLMSLADKDGRVEVTQCVLSEKLGVRRDAVARRVRTLMEFRWQGRPLLEVDGELFKSLSYRLLIPAQTKEASTSVSDLYVSDKPDTVATASDSSVSDKPDTIEMRSGGGIASHCPVSDAFVSDAPDTTAAVPKVLSPHNPLSPNLHGGVNKESPDTSESVDTSSFGGSQELETERGLLFREVISGRAHASSDTQVSKKQERVPRQESNVKRLIKRHAEIYEKVVGAPYLVVWGRDGACLKRLLKTYSAEDVEMLQDMYLEQPVDSFAGKQGYTITEFSREAPALMTRLQAERSLGPDDMALVEGLQKRGVGRETAVALVREHDPGEIRKQLSMHGGRGRRYQNPGALVKAIRDGWPAADEDERDLPDLNDIEITTTGIDLTKRVAQTCGRNPADIFLEMFPEYRKEVRL